MKKGKKRQIRQKEQGGCESVHWALFMQLKDKDPFSLPPFFHSLGSRSRTVPTDMTGHDRTRQDTTGHDRISTLPFQTPILSSLCPPKVFVVFISSSPHSPPPLFLLLLPSFPPFHLWPSNCTVPSIQSWGFIGPSSLFMSFDNGRTRSRQK